MQISLKHSLLKIALLGLTASLGEAAANQQLPANAKLVNITSGTYELGSFLSDSLTIDGATLTGTGSITGDLTIENNGKLSAGLAEGSKIGTINVGGNYIQSGDSTLALEVSQKGTNDFVFVHNNAQLAGTLEVIPVDGPIDSKRSQLIMRVDGNVSGKFDQIVSRDDALSTNLYFIEEGGGTNVILGLDNYFTAYTRTRNQQAIGSLIANHPPENHGAASLRQEILDIAQSDSPERVQHVYDQMSGYQYGSVLPVAQLAVYQYLRRLYDPLRSIVTYYREPSNCWDPQYFDPYSNLPILVDNPCDLCTPVPPTLDFWFDIGGGRAHFEGNSNAHGFHVNNFEITAGVQTTFLSDWTLGGSLSYARQTFSRYGDGSGGVNNGFLGLYTLYRPMGWYALADLVLGYNQGKISRRIETDENSYRSHAGPQTYEAVFYVEGGFDWPWKRFLIQPFLGLEFGSYSRNGIHEHGFEGTNLDIFGSDKSTAASRLGIHMTTFPEVLCNYTLSFDFAWQYRFNGAGSSVHGYSSSFSDEFHTRGITTDRNLFDAAATLSTNICEDWELWGGVDLLGSSNLFAYEFTFGFKYRW